MVLLVLLALADPEVPQVPQVLLVEGELRVLKVLQVLPVLLALKVIGVLQDPVEHGDHQVLLVPLALADPEVPLVLLAHGVLPVLQVVSLEAMLRAEVVQS